MANANRNVHVQNGFMDPYLGDITFNLSQIQIQDLEMIAETYNISPSTLEYANSHGSHGNMQATHGNMPANHGNMQEILGNMQIVHGNMQAINGNVHPVQGNIQAIYANTQAIHVDDDWQVNPLYRMGGEEL